MASKETCAVSVTDDSGNSCAGILHYTAFNPADRMKRALTALLLCWLAAVVSVFIIIVHWVLVPGFLIAGPILAIKQYKQVGAKENVQTQCPRCNRAVTIGLEASDQLPKWVYCPQCNGGVKLDVLETSQA